MREPAAAVQRSHDCCLPAAECSVACGGQKGSISHVRCRLREAAALPWVNHCYSLCSADGAALHFWSADTGTHVARTLMILDERSRRPSRVPEGLQAVLKSHSTASRDVSLSEGLPCCSYDSIINAAFQAGAASFLWPRSAGCWGVNMAEPTGVCAPRESTWAACHFFPVQGPFTAHLADLLGRTQEAGRHSQSSCNTGVLPRRVLPTSSSISRSHWEANAQVRRLEPAVCPADRPRNSGAVLKAQGRLSLDVRASPLAHFHLAACTPLAEEAQSVTW